MRFSAAISAAAIVPAVFAHTIMVSVNNNPVGYAVRAPSYDGPITNVQSNDIACNGPSNGGNAAPIASPHTIEVKAGESVQLTWRHTLTSGANDIIDAGHKGPVMAYMKKVSNAQIDNGVGNGWFKIYQDGLSKDGNTWGVDNLLAAKGIQTVTIPKCIADGDYLLRGELIALHGAGSIGGAQFYMECAQIKVTGGTASKTPATVALPGTYKATDPGVHINIFYPKPTTYTIPGPDVFTC